MPFAPGRKKTGGRSKGTQNRTTAELRQRLQSIVEGYADQIEQDLRELEPRERLNAWARLAEFVLPKLQRSEVETTTTGQEQDTKKEWVIQLAANCPHCDGQGHTGDKG